MEHRRFMQSDRSTLIDYVMPNNDIAFKWRPIEDFEDLTALGCPEVRTLASIWNEMQSKVPASKISELNTRLAREWAIETGIIEGLYTLDLGTTKTLIEAGFVESLIPRTAHSSPARLTAMLRDHEAALESLHDAVTNQRPLSTSFIKELHAHLTQNQESADAMDPDGRFMQVELLRGDWKVQKNNPTRPDGQIHEYCPPEHVASEMDRLIEIHHAHDRAGYPAEVCAAWLHHAFTQIHPFQDGNGRVARSIASLVLIRHGLFPLVVTRDDKREYLLALESADAGDPHPLVDLFARLQRNWLSRGIAISQHVSTGSMRLEQVVASLAKSSDDNADADNDLLVLGNQLAHEADSITKSTIELLAAAAGSDGPRFLALSSLGRADWRSYNLFQSVEAAKYFDFYANRSTFREWTILRMDDADRRMEILISIDGFGRQSRGVLAATATVYEKAPAGEDAGRAIAGLSVLGREVFLANIKDDKDTIRNSFRAWAEEMLATGLPAFRWNP